MRDTVITAYKAVSPEIPTRPWGRESDTLPQYSCIECWDSDGTPFLKEYMGSNKLAGKKAMITGGVAGIGRTISIFFAREGADVSIVYFPSEQEEAEALRSQISKTCFIIPHLIPVDFRTPEAPRDIIASHLGRFKYIDILVNNESQQVLCKEIADMEDSDIRNTFHANILHMIFLTKEAVPHMKRGAAIINTASATAQAGAADAVDYSASKGAVVAFTRSMASQLATKGIRVNAVAPGPFCTSPEPLTNIFGNEEERLITTGPLRGRAGQPAEIGEVYVLLAGPGSNFLTGSVIHVNGGALIGGS